MRTINKHYFDLISEHNGFVLGNEIIDDSDGFTKNSYFIGKLLDKHAYEIVVYIPGFTYTSMGVIEEFKERVDELSA